MRCYIFDLDGTLCDIGHRLHFIKGPKWETSNAATPSVAWKPDWDSFYAACVGDVPIKPICDLAWHLAQMCPLIFVSGRSDAVRAQTIDWLAMNVNGRIKTQGAHLWMRKHGDHRHDHVVKAEMLDEILAKGWQPIMAFDDRKQVVDMWRSRGIVCAQVAEGDF